MGMREEFEAAACAVILAGHPDSGLTVEEIATNREGESYKSSAWAGMWWAWQASRAALVIKLPEIFQQYNGDNNQSIHASDVCKSLTQAGVSYK